MIARLMYSNGRMGMVWRKPVIVRIPLYMEVMRYSLTGK